MAGVTVLEKSHASVPCISAELEPNSAASSLERVSSESRQKLNTIN